MGSPDLSAPLGRNRISRRPHAHRSTTFQAPPEGEQLRDRTTFNACNALRSLEALQARIEQLH
eukprot:8595310-Alexandrium_andersonii.AAC.1